MALELRDCTFFGPALPEPFAKFELEPLLRKAELWPATTAEGSRELREFWQAYRRKLRELGEHGGAVRVLNHVIAPLAPRLGYGPPARQEEVETREGSEDGGWLLRADGNGHLLRAWAVEAGTDLDAPNRRGRAYRFSPSRVAQRVLLAKSERVGLLTDGEELRLLVCDPARPDSHVAINLGRSGGWRGAHEIPDSFRVLLALARPEGVAGTAEITDAARLTQTRVTAKLREQARSAVADFVQELLDHSANRERLAPHDDRQALARDLWREGLVLIYRLLFILKLEASSDPARAFSFASTTLWRNSYSPNTALARHAREVLDKHAETGRLLEDGLRTLFRFFSEGPSSNQLNIRPLGGMLFGGEGTRLIDSLEWGERAVAKLLDRLLWTPASGKIERQRVHYGPLDVEDLGRVYEALLELEPGIATEPMCRLRRQKLEVVVPLAQGEAYRAATQPPAEDEDDTDEEDAEEEPAGGKKTKVIWIEEIPAGRFYLRVGLGRKSTGSYYTPHPFVRFLVQETLDPQVEERSPKNDPKPAEILKLKVLDPAMGSGHFLVEACRFLGDKLYEACRLCDELAMAAEERQPDRAAELRARIENLPDPNDELVAYLPSRVPEGAESGVSQRKAEAIARRLVAVHCLYGVDKNPLAVELARLSLWLESYAEGLPLTFLDHRLVCGDSLTGPFFDHLLTLPGSGKPIDDLFAQGLTKQLTSTLHEALAHVRELEKSVGKDVAEVESKRAAKARLDAALAPFKLLAHAWSGGVMLGERCDDVAYHALVKAVASRDDTQALLTAHPMLREMIAAAQNAVPYDLEFPEVFYNRDELGPGQASKGRGQMAGGWDQTRAGFNAVVGNPPWDAVRRDDDEFFGQRDFAILALSSKAEKQARIDRVLADPDQAVIHGQYIGAFEARDAISGRLFTVHQARVMGNLAGRGTYDDYMLFGERAAQVAGSGGWIGMILPSGFHANEGATGLRRLFLRLRHIRSCFSFENRKRLFEIHASFKFAGVVVAPEPADSDGAFDCAFYLREMEWLFSARQPLRYTLAFVERTGGEYLSLLELRSQADVGAVDVCFSAGLSFGECRRVIGVQLSQELNMTYDSERFTATRDVLLADDDPREPEVASRLRTMGYLPLHEGKTFHQYDDRWGDRPRYVVGLDEIADKANWLKAARHYRLAFRDIASSTNERTGIFCLLPPGFVCGNKAPSEREPADRPTSLSLALLGVLDAFAFDFVLRLKVAATVNLFILDGCPVPRFEGPGAGVVPFLAHSALRLSCNHAGYAPLWREQVGDAWREPGRALFAWPVVDGDDAHWLVRATIDAVAADAYGLSRDQYAHVLSSFSHKSYPKAPEVCLAAFDELHAIGLEAFCRKHDPYWDIPLNEKLPEPVIDLPIPETVEAAAKATAQGGLFAGAAPKPARGRKARAKKGG